MRVENVTNKNGNAIPNQFLIFGSDSVTFQSYRSTIAIKKGFGSDEKITLDEHYWDYSVTTGKYRNQFLSETKKETEAKIKSGEYTLANLN